MASYSLSLTIFKGHLVVEFALCEAVAYHGTENTAQVPGVVSVRHISDGILTVVQASIHYGQANIEDVSLKLRYRKESVF